MVRVSAADPDDGENGRVRYSIENATGGWPAFGIDAQTGSVFTVSRLDRETVDKYEFDVRATDSGNQGNQSMIPIARIFLWENVL